MADYLWLIPCLPLLASIVIAFAGPRWLRGQSHWPCLLAVAAACFLSMLVAGEIISQEQGDATLKTYYSWVQSGKLDVGMTLRADALSAIMLVTVTFVGTLIAIYSAGYMHGDPGYPRFFACVALFIFCMTGLVMADNFVLLYAGWEGVGVCSYLLIGFWFQRPSAAAAARKAFLVNRIGDFGFMLGILLLWSQFGFRLDYQSVFDRADTLAGTSTLTAICLLLFCGAVGKSAQFPLHVWLADAMEGPSPVSALIHAATMVTAGVYMVARCMPLYQLAPDALLAVAGIGAFTAMLAALIALTQTDLKRVLAYSTMSQLGYMFLALGSAAHPTITYAAVLAAIFHLFTHAFFKALLFLAAGSVMHAMGDVIDMRRFSGLRRLLPTTHWTFLMGALALSGFPLWSGFWSKDEILGVALEASKKGVFPTYYMIFFMAGVITAALTAFYTFRAYFLTFWGEERIPPEAGEHAHESPPIMTVPLVILAVLAAGIGLVAQPLTGWFGDLLAKTPGLHEHPHHANIIVMLGSSLFAIAGIALAYWMYVKEPKTADELADSVPGLYDASRNKFYLDEAYYNGIVRPAHATSVVCRIFDLYILDGLIDLLAHGARWLGQLFRPIQNGLVQFYALAMVLGLGVFLISLVWALGG
ncbi:MAG: NADH-quinone oxidoreductase subunit L [Gemmatales bacterium]|nr:MAG: NADH-quinone oxidoreductase subunit L [Gemmatales bacterium]